MIKVGIMRLLDKWVGGTLCRIMAVFWSVKRLIRPRANAEFPPEKIRNILVIKFFGAGSLYLAWPMFKGIRKRFANARIHVVTFASNKEFLEIMDCADEILPVRNDNIWHFGVDLLKHWWRLLFHRPDLSFDLEFFSNSSVLFAMLYLARIRVGLFAENAKRGDLLTVRASFNHYRHVSEVFFRLAEVVGVESEPEFFDLPLPSMGDAYNQGVRPKLHLRDSQNFAVVNVNSSDLFLHRRWPRERFEQFIRAFRKKYPSMKVVLVGAPAERDYVGELHSVLAEDEHVLNLAGRTSMREFLALLERATIFVSNDSGPVHFASGYETPTVALFGPETPVLYRPLNPRSMVLHSGLYCSPCMNIYANKDFRGCRDNACMKTITVGQVMAAAEALLVGRPSSTYDQTDRYIATSRAAMGTNIPDA